jgi:hypothetical protein
MRPLVVFKILFCPVHPKVFFFTFSLRFYEKQLLIYLNVSKVACILNLKSY